MAKKDQAYYQNLLSQYIDGSISKEGRFELEKYALDDPFLFEALEGYNLEAGDKKRVLEKLKEKTTSSPKNKSTRRIPLMNYGIAASLILILGVGLWFFNLPNTANEQIALQSSTSDEKVNASPNVKEGEALELIIEEVADHTEETNLAESARDNSNNQYDSPKARISQVETDDISDVAYDTQVNVESEPPAIKEESTIALIHEEQSGAAIAETKIEKLENDVNGIAGQAAAVKSDPVRESTSKARKMEQSKEEAIEESSDSPSSIATVATDRQLRLERDQYLTALDQSTLVAPEGGITKLENLLARSTEKLKSINQSSNEKVVILFSLNKDGRPTDFDIRSGTNQACINIIVSTLKQGVDWITEPPNTEAKVQLSISCNGN